MNRPILFLLALCLGTAAFARAEASCGPVFDSPVMGWSSWNTYRVHINDTLIRRQADALVATGLQQAGYCYVNIDDGFFGRRDASGRMQTHPERFPEGLKPVADHIHDLGLKAGIYSDAGANTCGSIWDDDVHGVGAGLYGHEYEDAALYFREWGFDFIKIDYCGAGQELNLDEERRYTEIRRAIDALGCGHVSINICRWAFPGTWARALARSWRISGDIAPTWPSVRQIIARNLYLSAYAGGGHYNDMDMLEIGRGLSPDEEETHFGMWCIMASPLLIGCDLCAIPERSLALLKNPELIALNQDPLGLQARVVQHEGAGYVLAKDVETLRGPLRAVALYNPSDEPCTFRVPVELLECAGRIRVRDLVRRVDLPDLKAGLLQRTVPPHGVAILRLEAERRIEPTRYEAEWAYLPCFNDLGKDPRTVCYAPAEGASGGMVVRHLGGRAENCAEWADVYSERGGSYLLTVYYRPHAGRRLEIGVNNDRVVAVDSPAPEECGPVASAAVRVRLQAGYNRVRMGNPFGWSPDIDCFTVERTGD